MFGWCGTIARVNLSSGKITREPLPEKTAREFLGGAGLAAKILWDEVGPEVRPYDPDNRLIFSAGPLSGTLSPGSGRMNVTNKSPHTQGYTDSNVGGFFGPELKYAGYDALIVEGKAEKPVYIIIDDGQIQIRDASHLWGKTTWETEDIIKSEIGDPDIQVGCIGPAGENIVRYSTFIINRARAPGWGGSGAVAGSKNLKAIAVRGSKGVKIAKPKDFLDACYQVQEDIKRAPIYDQFSRWAWWVLLPDWTYGSYPENSPFDYNKRTVPGAIPLPKEHFDQAKPENIEKALSQKHLSCFGCPMHCSNWVVVKNGPYAGSAGEGYEATAQAGGGYVTGNFDQRFIAHYNITCNQLGLDVAGPGAAISWAMKCFSKGIFNLKDTDGIELKRGNEEAVMKFLYKIAHREGLGDILAEDVYWAAKKVGKGSELFAEYGKGGCGSGRHGTARESLGAALANAVSTRGPCHLKGHGMLEFGVYSDEYLHKIGFTRQEIDPMLPEGKAKSVIWNERLATLCDSITMCKNISHYYVTFVRETDFARLISLATGWDVTPEELIVCADRINAIEKAYNCRSGVGGREEDKLPRSIHEIPTRCKLPLIKREDLEKMKDDYYTLHKWDVATGFPTIRSLEDLALREVAESLQNQGFQLKSG